MDASEEPDYLNKLHKGMIDYYTLEELHMIAFTFKIDWDELPGETISIKAIYIILRQIRENQLQELVDLLKRQRPNARWPEIPAIPSRIKTDAELWKPAPEKQGSTLISVLEIGLGMEVVFLLLNLYPGAILFTGTLALTCFPSSFGMLGIYGLVRSEKYDNPAEKQRCRHFSIAVLTGALLPFIPVAGIYIGVGRVTTIGGFFVLCIVFPFFSFGVATFYHLFGGKKLMKWLRR